MKPKPFAVLKNFTLIDGATARPQLPDRSVRHVDEAALLDVDAARAAVAPAGKVGIVGYCWGGLVTWLAANKASGLAAAVDYALGEVAGTILTAEYFGGERHGAVELNLPVPAAL